MSAARKLTKKQKKALAFRERKGKGKGKSFDELDNDVPVEENQDLAEAEVDAAPGAVEAPQGRAADAKAGGAQAADALGSGHRPKKRKREEGPGETGEGAKEQKSKKKRKDEDGAGVVAGDATEGEVKEGGKQKVKQRYILFVGNLRYTTTKETVEKHFSKCDPPPTVRLMTPKPSANAKPNRSKGFAFVEFSHKNALQQGLKLHQTELDGRKINVELTAGGGGKSEQRLEKVKKRNKELHEQRKKNLLKQKSGKSKQSGDAADPEDVQMERPQRYSATSGVEQMPSNKRTWSIPEEGDGDAATRKRGSKKGKRPPRSQGTGVNATPVG